MSIEQDLGHQASGLARGLDLRGMLQIFRRHWLLMLCFIVLAPAAALAYSLHETKEYSATATLLFRESQATSQNTSATQTPTEFDTDPARVVATNVQLISLPSVIDATARKLHVSSAHVKSEITIGAGAGDTDAVAVQATDPSPSRAAALANTYARQYIKFRRDADIAKITASQSLIGGALGHLGPNGAKSTRASQLSGADSQLQIAAALQTGGAELVQTAQVPTSASSPDTRSNVVFGLLVGIILALAAAALRHRLDRRLHYPEQAAEIFGRPLLATIPYERAFSVNGSGNPARASEAFYMLRANLRYFNLSGPRRSVLVTSPLPGDGKSTVVWNLGVAVARAGQSVLILEADLRRPTLREHIAGEFEHPHGLVDVLTDSVPLEAAIKSVKVSGSGGDSELTMDVLLAGTVPPNPVDLVESDKLGGLLREVASRYDLVLVDTPPTAIVPDAIPILSHVDGVLVVCRLERTTRPPTLHLRTHLQNLSAPVLGVVVNGARAGRGYGYGYYPYRSGDGAAANGRVQDGASLEQTVAVVSEGEHGGNGKRSAGLSASPTQRGHGGNGERTANAALSRSPTEQGIGTPHDDVRYGTRAVMAVRALRRKVSASRRAERGSQ